MENKKLVIIAGANGSGKSTLVSQIEYDGEFINADKCEKLSMQFINLNWLHSRH